MAAKNMITVFILDDKGLTGVMDGQGNKEKFPMLHSLACVYEDHKDIGTKLLTAGKDEVFHAEAIEEAIANYDPKAKSKDESKDKSKDKKKDSKKDDKKKDDKGNYDTKVMTPST
mgnify:CR=1 FL=1